MGTFPVTEADIPAIPNAQRQKLVVLPSDELQELVRVLAGPRMERPPVASGTLVAQLAATTTSRVVGRAGTGWWSSLAMMVADPGVRKQVKRWWKKWQLSRKAGLGILYADAAAVNDLEFPAGHPIHNLLYVAHPTDSHRYLVAAEFHRAAFQDKAAEAIGLLRALGAAQLTVRHVTGWRREIGLSLASEGADPVEGTANSNHEQSEGAEILFTARYAPTHAPSLPENLHWYFDEPLWKQIADGRLHSNLRTFTLDLSYQQDFGIDVAVAAAVQSVGFSLGGEFKAHLATQWQITGEFAG